MFRPCYQLMTPVFNTDTWIYKRKSRAVMIVIEKKKTLVVAFLTGDVVCYVRLCWGPAIHSFTLVLFTLCEHSTCYSPSTPENEYELIKSLLTRLRLLMTSPLLSAIHFYWNKYVAPCSWSTRTMGLLKGVTNGIYREGKKRAHFLPTYVVLLYPLLYLMFFYDNCRAVFISCAALFCFCSMRQVWEAASTADDKAPWKKEKLFIFIF